MAKESQTPVKAEAPGVAIYNPPQKYPKSVKIGGRTHTIRDTEGRPLGGKPNPCPITDCMIGLGGESKMYNLPVGATYRFSEAVAEILLEKFHHLKKVSPNTKQAREAPIAPSREPTEREAKLYHMIKRKAEKGERMFGLTPERGHVLLTPTGEHNIPVEGIKSDDTEDGVEDDFVDNDDL